MIIDPYCSYSVRAFDELRPYVTAGRIQLAIVPISILDYEDNGQSTPAAQSLLSQDPAQMAEAWDHQNFRLAPLRESAPALLEKNNRIAEEIGLHGHADTRLAQGGWERRERSTAFRRTGMR